jgi:enoyl-[acyl-carrier protein] reductase/trans-2-enoyl-CoA reductase (NAD+)
MKLALPEFKFRFMAAAGNVIFPANFHPVGTQQGAADLVARASAGDPVDPGAGGRWLIIGGSGGFGSAARVALACDHGAHTFSVSFDQAPNPASGNKIRKIGSPGWHRNLAVERELRALGLLAESRIADAYDAEARAQVLADLREWLGGEKLAGVVWALAAPRGTDPRTGKPVKSALKPLGKVAQVKTFAGPEAPEDDAPIVEFEIKPGTPEEAIATIFVMGGGIVTTWVDALRDGDLCDRGFTALTISYRGNPLNSNVYRHGLIGLAKADLEFHTKGLDAQLQRELDGRAIAVEGPAVVTEASGAIPGVPLYMALIREVLGERFEDPLDSMRRMFSEHVFADDPGLDDEGLLRMDDRELAEEIQAEMARRFAELPVGAALDRALFDQFMHDYQQTRGFGVPGIDYAEEFDTDEVCAVD